MGGPLWTEWCRYLSESHSFVVMMINNLRGVFEHANIIYIYPPGYAIVLDPIIIVRSTLVHAYSFVHYSTQPPMMVSMPATGHFSYSSSVCIR